jgi:hypothetical protein
MLAEGLQSRQQGLQDFNHPRVFAETFLLAFELICDHG